MSMLVVWCPCLPTPAPPSQGCYKKLKENFESNLLTIGAIVIVMCIIEVRQPLLKHFCVHISAKPYSYSAFGLVNVAGCGLYGEINYMLNNHIAKSGHARG